MDQAGAALVTLGLVVAGLRSTLLFWVRLNLPEINLGALFAVPNLLSPVGSLLVSHPSRIVVRLPEPSFHQMDGFASAVRPSRSRIEWHSDHSDRSFSGSVTSWRKSSFGGTEAGADIISEVAVATVLFLLLGAVFGLGFFAFQAGTRQRLAADHIQKSLDTTIKVVCDLYVASNCDGFNLESPKGHL